MLATKVSTKENVDPSGKNKNAIYLPLVKEDLTIYHWNKHTRMKWTMTYFLGIFLVYSVRSSMSICATAISKDLGWTKKISGMALSAFFCGYITTNVLGGYLADRHGGEVVIFYTSIIWASLTLILPMLVQSESMLYSGTAAILVVRFFTGVAQGVFFPSITAILAKHVAVSERGFVYGFAYSGSSVGVIVTGFVGSIIIDHVGWPGVFITVGVFALLWVVWMKYLSTLTSSTKQRIPDKVVVKPAKGPVPWLKLASCSPVWALFVAYFCCSYCFYNLLSWTPVYFHDAFPESKGWVFNVIPWLANFILTNISGYVANILISGGMSITFVRKLYASILFIGIIVFSLMLTVVETFKQALFVMSLNIGVNAFATCSVGLNSQDLAPKHAGALHGIMNCCGAFAGFVGVYITGYILEVTNMWSSVYILTSIVSCIGLIVYSCFGSGERIV